MKVYIFSYFIIGFLIGFLSFNTIYSNSNVIKATEYVISRDKYIDTTKTERIEFKPPKILCVILTSRKFHETRAIHVQNTWGKRCDKLIFSSTITDTNLGSIGFNITDDHGHLWGKVKLIFHHIYETFIDDYDWIYKGDDDTFVVFENMQYLLASYSPKDPIYFGHRFKTDEHKYGYFSGGSGYVMSNTALRLFAEKILSNTSFCNVENDEGNEDWNMGLCFDIAGVYPVGSRDLAKKERFVPFGPEGHLFPYLDQSYWYWQRHYYKSSDGLGSLSNYLVSTHYIDPKYMYTLYFLTYHLNVFGIRRKFPPIGKKVRFDDIVEAAKHDRNLFILRGLEIRIE